MHKKVTFINLISLLTALLILTACAEKAPKVEWELVIDGDIEQPKTFTYQDLVKQRSVKLDDVLTQNPDNPGERTSWEGVTLRRLFRQVGAVEFSINWWTKITLADGSTYRLSTADLRGGIIAFKDGQGNWLAETEQAPIRLILQNKPSDQWLTGPVRITIHKP